MTKAKITRYFDIKFHNVLLLENKLPIFIYTCGNQTGIANSLEFYSRKVTN